MDSRDIFLGIIGLVSIVYGGYNKDTTTLTIGIATLFLAVQMNLSDHDEEIRILKAQINTQNELKKIREELKQIKDELNKEQKRKN